MAAANDGSGAGPTITRRHALGDGVDGAALATRLARFVHPGHAPIAGASVDDGRALVVHEAVVAGDTLADEPRGVLTDKVLALGQELVPVLVALADTGLAHGALDAQQVVRRDDGGLVLRGARGLGADGQLAAARDDVKALAAMLQALLPERAPEVTRRALAELEAEPVPLGDLGRRLVQIRAAIPLPAGRQIRSIQRLAFPPPKNAPKKSKRHIVRVVLLAGVVALGLYAAFSGTGGGTIAWSRPATEPAPTPRATRPDDGKTLYIRLPPLVPTPPAPKTNGTP